MITSKLKIIAASALFLAAGASWGVTVDFDHISSPESNPRFGFYQGPLETQGFSFTTEMTPTNHGHLMNDLGACPSDGGYTCVSNGTQYIGENMANVIMTQVGGGTFSLSQFDATNADLFSHVAKTIVVEGTGSGGPVSQVFNLTESTFHTFTLNASFTNLTSVTFRGAGPAGASDNLWIAVDNINTDVLPTDPVPEPETYAMLLAGLGVVSALARRRRG